MRIGSALLLIIFLCSQSLSGSGEEAVNSLKNAINEGKTDLIPLALDAGSLAIPDLREMLSTTDKRNQILAIAFVLGYIGGDESIRLICEMHQKLKREKPDEYDQFYEAQMLSALCIAVSSRGNSEDVSLLINVLRDGKSWSPIQAALALGVLRSKEAILDLKDALKKTPTNNEASFYAFHWINDALCWINRDPATVIADGIKAPDNDIIRAIFIYGIPRLCWAHEVYDKTNQGKWLYDTDSWIFRGEIKAEFRASPQIDYDIYIAENGTNATVTMNTEVRDNNSRAWYSYNILLVKKGSEWKVRVVFLSGMD